MDGISIRRSLASPPSSMFTPVTTVGPHSPKRSAAIEQEKLLCWLLDHGENPNIVSERRSGSCVDRCTPLAAAVELSSPSSVELLLSHGAEVDPLAIFSAIGGHTWERGTATLEALIRHGANVNYEAERWGTPLFHAVHWAKEDRLKVLLKHGADTTYRLEGKMTAADYARQLQRPELAIILEEVPEASLP
jgi:ankyrin repeat protein